MSQPQLKNNYTPKTIANVLLNFLSTSTLSFFELEPPDHKMETKDRSPLLPRAHSYIPKGLLVLSIFIHSI